MDTGRGEEKFSNLKTEKYTEQLKRLPQTGKHIIARKEGNSIIVYQAFQKKISEYALANQKFGGPHYSYNRMSWIKPGFLWMMHRSGWATKENQEHILAISLPFQHFKTILQQACISSYDPKIYTSRDCWKKELENTEVRLQWDPDHDPFGVKQQRKAIQLGIKGEILKLFCTEWIEQIEDVSDFVQGAHAVLQSGGMAELNIPLEEIISVNNKEVERKIGLSI